MHQATDHALLGESGRTSPPALPIKQRRSQSSSSSIQDVELNVDLPLSGPQTPLTPFADVFVSTDCNAIHCPIHRYEHHQTRFFSDQTPPPVPKKSLRRTISLPTDALDPPYPAHSGTHNYDNPLYMIAPFQDQKENYEEELHEGQSLQQVTFDIPDEQLCRLLRSFQSYEQVSMSIQECYLQFLREALLKIETSVFVNEQECKIAKTSHPNDFLLCGQQWTGKDVYYLVCCPKIPRRLFAAKVHREDSASDSPVPLLHPNLKQVVVHFPQCTATNRTHALQPESPQTTPDPSHGGSTDPCQQQTVVSLLEKGVSVTVSRDFPLGTLEDFVEEGHSLHCTHPEVYERRLCLLVLQLVMGLQVLGQHKELKPQSFMLAWPSVTWKAVDSREYLSEMKKGRDVNSDPSSGEPNKITVSEDQLDNGKTKGEMCQALWEKWGTPRVVLNFEDEEEATLQEHQLGDLLKYCLHLTDSGSALCKVPAKDTPYSQGLLWLVNQLSSEKPGILMADVPSVLQVLLWGPRKGLFQHNQMESTLFSNWLLVKQSLLVLKLAEQGLFQDQHGLDWEDYLCLQYLSFTDIETLCDITAQLGLHNFVRPV